MDVHLRQKTNTMPKEARYEPIRSMDAQVKDVRSVREASRPQDGYRVEQAGHTAAPKL